MADPNWRGGNYLAEGVRPEKGLAVARMAAHITYLSETALKRKFDRKLQDRTSKTFGFDADFQIAGQPRKVTFTLSLIAPDVWQIEDIASDGVSLRQMIASGTAATP